MPEATLSAVAQQIQLEIENNQLEMPMLPKVTQRVLGLVNDPDSDAQQLATLIQSDQALAGHVMRIANSAAYSPAVKMTSLQQAIARLGMGVIGEIALASTMGPKLFQAPGFEDFISSLWKLSLATAVWTRELARHERRHVESAFLCGLLCQIGKPVVLQTALKYCHAHQYTLNEEIIHTLFSNYQATVGAVVAAQWELPELVRDTILGLECRPESGTAQEIVDTIKAALHFAAVSISHKNYDAESLCQFDEITAINLYEDDVEQLIGKADAVHQTIEALTL